MSYENILVEQRGAVTLITLNRPQALNALNSLVLEELIDAFAKAFEQVGQVVAGAQAQGPHHAAAAGVHHHRAGAQGAQGAGELGGNRPGSQVTKRLEAAERGEPIYVRGEDRHTELGYRLERPSERSLRRKALENQQRARYDARRRAARNE